jgi:hypothetical protein
VIAHFCPVCWRPVNQTPGQCISGHFDKAQGYCPGSFEPFFITVRTVLGAGEGWMKAENRPQQPKNGENGRIAASSLPLITTKNTEITADIAADGGKKRKYRRIWGEFRTNGYWHRRSS